MTVVLRKAESRGRAAFARLSTKALATLCFACRANRSTDRGRARRPCFTVVFQPERLAGAVEGQLDPFAIISSIDTGAPCA
jgi:hypothetical protein